MATRKGSAGFGVSQAVDQFGSNAYVGAEGERQFAEYLRKSGLTSSVDVWYSVKVPGRDGATRGDSDVDIVLSAGKRILLIDVKRWASSKESCNARGSRRRSAVAYWSIPLVGLPMKNWTPLRKKSGEWALSRNMDMARDRFRSLLPGFTVESIVVFVPTTKDGRGPASVRFLRWPGGIRSYSVGPAIKLAFRFFRGLLGVRTNSKGSTLLSRMVVTGR